MSDDFRGLLGFVFVCSAFWSVMIGAAAHSLSWLVFAAICAVVALIAWSE